MGFISFYWCVMIHACLTLQFITDIFPILNRYVITQQQLPSLSSTRSVSGLCSQHFTTNGVFLCSLCELMSHPLACSHNLSRAPFASTLGLEHGPLSLSIWQHSPSVVYTMMEKFQAMKTDGRLNDLVVISGRSRLKSVRSEILLCGVEELRIFSR